jgi:hypothetical protein
MAKVSKCEKKSRAKARPKKKSPPKLSEFKIPQYTDFRGTEACGTEACGTEAFRDFCSSTRGPLEFESCSFDPWPSLEQTPEPPPGTMLNPAEHTSRSVVKEIIPATIGEWVQYFHYPETLMEYLPPTRWERFKFWVRNTFIID